MVLRCLVNMSLSRLPGHSWHHYPCCPASSGQINYRTAPTTHFWMQNILSDQNIDCILLIETADVYLLWLLWSCLNACWLCCCQVMRSSTWCVRIHACAFLRAVVLQMEKPSLPNRMTMKKWSESVTVVR